MDIDKQSKSGNNINQIIDVAQTVNNFIQVYFSYLNSNPHILVNEKIIDFNTTFKYNDNKYINADLINLLNEFKNYNYTIDNLDYLESGSRRIDILTNGKMIKDDETFIFNQTFLICFANDKWFLKNSILIINNI